MGYRRILAVFAALTVMGTVFSCSKEKGTSTVIDSSVSSEDETASAKGSESGGSDDTTDSDGSKTTTASKDKSDKDTTTTKAGEKKADTTTTAKGGSSAGNNSGGSGNNSGGSGSSSGDSGNNSGSSGGSSGNSGNNGGGGSENNNSGGEEEKEYTAEITLGGNISVKGSNVTVSGSTVTISKEGDYIFSGNLSEGQIIVKTGVRRTEDKVTLVLNGVNISNSSQPAIYVDECERCTIKPKDGTVNYISSGVEKKGNKETGAIFSNDTLKFKGKGELNITATASHGIKCDDEVTIESGTYNIESDKSGIIADIDVTVNDGNTNIKAGTNGIKSKGTLNICGGRTVVSGGTKEEKSSLYAPGVFSYTGGYLYAAGSKVSVPTYSDYPFIVVDLGETVGAGSSVEMVLNGTSAVNMNPHNDFRCLLMLSPDISSGSSFHTVINGGSSDDFIVSGGQNMFNLK